MRSRLDIERLIEDINTIQIEGIKTKGQFRLRERVYKNNNYPHELELSLMFIKEGVEICPYVIISRNLVITFNNTSNIAYDYFYNDLMKYLIFCRADTTQTFIDNRGDEVKYQSISQWLTEG